MRFVESKNVDWVRVRALLDLSEQQNQWANFGPVSRRLEQEIERMLRVPPDRAVVVTSSGTSALFALCGVMAARAGHALRWLGSAFAFASTRNGPLAGGLRFVDCDDDGLLDLDAVARIPIGDWDALLVTNTFGRCASSTVFTRYCRDRGKAIIVDNAQCLLGYDRSASDTAEEMISFHHTKPWGMGEGGCAILRRADEDLFRSLLNFGYQAPSSLAHFAANGKMSDIAAAAILARLEKWPFMARTYNDQWQRLAAIAVEVGYSVFAKPTAGAAIGFVPLLAPSPVGVATVKQSQLPLAKYYPPLAELANARRLYDHMVGIASHPGMADVDDALIRSELNALIGRG